MNICEVQYIQEILPMHIKIFFLLLFIIWQSGKIQGQNTKDDKKKFGLKDSSHLYFTIKTISIEGNLKTKKFIIERELDFKVGDSIRADLIDQKLLLCKNRIINTKLFTSVSFTYKSDTVFILLQERFYTYPMLILGLADRNFNEWWVTRHHDLRRINYGINFIQKNISGRNDVFRILLQSGFSQKAEVNYSIPYFNKKRNTGFSIFASLISEKKIPFENDKNILHFLEGKKTLKRRLYTSVSISHRMKFYNSIYFTVGYNNNKIADTVVALNSLFYLNGQKFQKYFSFRASFFHDKRDITYYPLNGYYLGIDAVKSGLFPSDNIDQLNIYLNFSIYKKVSQKISLAAGAFQKISFPRIQPYANFRSLGYSINTVSGYELYVIDGNHFTLTKVNLKYRLFDNIIKINSFPLEKLKTIPLAIYFKLHFDAAYVIDNMNNEGNIGLSNKILYGNGIGFDFVTYYDLVFRVEYSINRNFQHGIFLNMKAAI